MSGAQPTPSQTLPPQSQERQPEREEAMVPRPEAEARSYRAAAEQHLRERLEDLPAEQLERTFRTNIFSMFHLTRAALPHLRPGARIINTTSVTAYRGSPHLVDYASTKGAIVAFTRSLALQLAERGIHVNAAARSSTARRTAPAGTTAAPGPPCPPP